MELSSMQPTLSNRTLRVEHEVGAHKHRECEYLGIVVRVSFNAIKAFSVEKENAEVFVCIIDGFAPDPDTFCTGVYCGVHFEL